LELSQPGHAMGNTLELWLLAGVLAEDAAKATRLPAEVVSAFAVDHFDIADRMDNTSFILSELVLKSDSPRLDSGIFLSGRVECSFDGTDRAGGIVRVSAGTAVR